MRRRARQRRRKSHSVGKAYHISMIQPIMIRVITFAFAAFMPKSRILGFVIKEFREVLPPTMFFAVGFNLTVLTTNLIMIR
jgi:hypothetical protein